VIPWLLFWTIFAASTGLVWEGLATGGVTLWATLARAVLVLAALALTVPVLVGVEIWWRILGLGNPEIWARRDDSDRFARRLTPAVCLAMFVPLALYVGLAGWALHLAWPPLLAWFKHLGPLPPGDEPPVTWMAIALLPLMAPGFVRHPATWGLGLAVTAAGVVWDRLTTGGVAFVPALERAAWVLLTLAAVRNLPLKLSSAARRHVECLRILGTARFFKGVLLMALIRFWQPRRDFFMQAPVISDMPWFAACVLLYAFIPIPFFAWAVPLALVVNLLVWAVDKVAPPAWLFLASTRYDSFLVFQKLRWAWGRNGVTLLDRNSAEGVAFYAAWRQAVDRADPAAEGLFWDPGVPRIWNLRTRPEHWEFAVLLLIDYVTAVVVDVRGSSDHLTQELIWLAVPERTEKAWFLVDDDGSRAGLDGAELEEHEQAVLAETVARHTVTLDRLLSMTWDRSGIHPPDGPGGTLKAENQRGFPE
jgi:hypothetical protein